MNDISQFNPDRLLNAMQAVQANTGINMQPLQIRVRNSESAKHANPANSNQRGCALSSDERDFLERRLTEIKYPPTDTERKYLRLATQIENEPPWFFGDVLFDNDVRFIKLKKAVASYLRAEPAMTPAIIGQIVIDAFENWGEA